MSSPGPAGLPPGVATALRTAEGLGAPSEGGFASGRELPPAGLRGWRREGPAGGHAPWPSRAPGLLPCRACSLSLGALRPPSGQQNCWLFCFKS